jgi:16S rRNA (guanine966-N2)-methyltransferase
MKIIAGRFKGLRVTLPRGVSLRPTTDRVREAIFSVLASLVPGSAVVDLCAGTGAFGLEALSRGAQRAVFVDSDRKTAAALRTRLEALGLEPVVKILQMDVSRAVEHLAAEGEMFSLIFLDPPYGDAVLDTLLSQPALAEILDDTGTLVVESDARHGHKAASDLWDCSFVRKYGDTSIEMFRKVTEALGH